VRCRPELPGDKCNAVLRPRCRQLNPNEDPIFTSEGDNDDAW
jgi:hypothetical protein